jgi:hypothetical protein
MKKYASEDDEENMKHISYYIFDMFNLKKMNLTFEERYNKLKTIFNTYKFKYLKLVTCENVKTLDEINALNEKYLYEGYEGVIVRNKNGLYKLNSKSYDVLRTKEFKKKEFKIISAKEGSVTQKGAILWNLQCLNNKNKNFWAIPIGTINERINIYKKYVSNPDSYIGKLAKVKFLEITLAKGQMLFIPAYWWYSVKFEKDACLCTLQYKTVMNIIATLPDICIGILQRQNTKIKINPTSLGNPSSSGESRTLDVPDVHL